MNFEQTVLNKLEKIEDKIDVHSDKLEKQTIEIAIGNKILDEHHKRSTQLEERLKPIEASYVFQHKLLELVVAVVSVFATIVGIYKYFIN